MLLEEFPLFFFPPKLTGMLKRDALLKFWSQIMVSSFESNSPSSELNLFISIRLIQDVSVFTKCKRW